MRIGFFGGSITLGGCASTHRRSYAYRTYQNIEKMTNTPCVYLNAAISGTGSEFGVHRIESHLLSLAPDVIFVEFAVNDAYQAQNCPGDICASMDRLVARIRTHCPKAAVIFLYAALEGMSNAAAVHETVAAHYGIPSIDLSGALFRELAAQQAQWSDYMTDGAHPNDRGHKLYADTIYEALRRHPEWLVTPPKANAPLTADLLPDARIASVQQAKLISGFSAAAIDDDRDKHLENLRVTEVLRADAPGSKLSVAFEGTVFGLYHRISAVSGGVKVTVDGESWGECNFFWNYPNTEFRGEFLTFCCKHHLPSGNHLAELETIAGKNGDRVEIAGFILG